MASPLTRMKRHRRFIGSRLALQCLSVRAARHRCVPTLSRRNPVRYSGLPARTRCGSGIVRQEQPHEELRGWKVRPTMVFPLPMSLSRRRNGVRAGSSTCLLSGRPIAGFCRPFSKVHGRSRAAGIACPNPTSRSVRLRGATQPGRSASKSGTIAFPTNLAATVTSVSAPFFRAGRTMRWSYATCRTTTGSRVTRIHSPWRPSPLQIRLRAEPSVKGRSPASGFVPSTISRVRDRRRSRSAEPSVGRTPLQAPQSIADIAQRLPISPLICAPGALVPALPGLVLRELSHDPVQGRPFRFVVLAGMTRAIFLRHQSAP